MKTPFRLLVPLLALLPCAAAAQQTTGAPLTLDRAIGQALEQSAIARQAATARETRYWQFRTYQANYRPQLSVQGTVPSYNQEIRLVEQPDGTSSFRPVRTNYANTGLTLSQNIGPTGGQVYVSSALQRVDNYYRNERTYSSQPFGVGFSQPIGRYNSLRWARKIEPLRYEESGRQYVEERETIAQRITELYFDVLLEQVNADVARQNVAANEELLRLGQERFRLGRLSQSDLLLLELNLLNSRKALGQARLDAQNTALDLQSYTGLPTDALQLTIPEATARLAVDGQQALTQARQHRRETVAFRRRLLEAESAVAQARGSTGFQATLLGSLGYVSSAPDLWVAYNGLQSQQQLSLAFSMPLVDWGRQKAILKTAELNRQQVQQNVAQEQTTFEQSVLVQAAQLGSLHEQLELSAQADSLARQRYAIARATYQVGRISLTDLNIALAEKDQSRRAYIAALRACWVARYRLRALTLYDFERQESLLAVAVK